MTQGEAATVPAGAKVVDAVIEGRAVRFCVADAGDKIQAKHARGKFWERAELAVMAPYFRPGDVFCDVGANVGNHALFVALFLDARVIAFEPNPAAMPLLCANVALNGVQGAVDLTHLGWGLSDHAATGLSPVTKRANLGATRLVDDGQGAIAVRPGDDLLAGARIDFLKIDVEGMEMQVLRGLSQTIARYRPPVFVELDHAQAPDLLAWVAAQDYVIAHQGPRYAATQDLLILPRGHSQDRNHA